MTFRALTMLASLVLSTASVRAADATVAAIPDDFPRFLVPGREKEMESLRRLF